MNKCVLEDNSACEKRNCEECGWNADIIHRRQLLLKKNGLTVCTDGLHRLVLPKSMRKQSESKNRQ